jgi:hypothetical protein
MLGHLFEAEAHRGEGKKIPALGGPGIVVRMSRPPNSRLTASIRTAAALGSRRSATWIAALRLFDLMDCAAVLSASQSRPVSRRSQRISRERKRNAASDAAARSRHERDLAGQA